MLPKLALDGGGIPGHGAHRRGLPQQQDQQGMVRAISAMYCIRSPPLKNGHDDRASHRRSWQHR